MPVLPPTPNPILKIRLIHGLGANLSIGTHVYWSYTGSAPTGANLATIGASIITKWTANLAALLSTNGVLENVQLIDISSASGAQAVVTSGAAGTRAGAQVTNMAAAVLQYKIARRYRGGKPKGFWPFGVAGDVVAGNTWSNAFQTAVNNGFAAFATAVNGTVGGGTTLGTQQSVSYFLGTTTNPNPSKWSKRNVAAIRAVPVLDPVTSVVISGILGNQRRRAGR